MNYNPSIPLSQVPEDDDFFGIVSLSCAGLWDLNAADTPPDGDLQCNGIITVNTEDVKQAKQDFSSIAFTALTPLDINDFPNRRLQAADIGQATGLVITGTNGAWGKSDNIRGITFTPLDGSILGGVFEVEIEYKTRGFNPV